MKLHQLFYVAFLGLTLAACSAKVEGTSPLSASVPNAQNQNPATATVLEGSWVSSCLVFSSQYSMTTLFTFTGNQIAVNVASFNDGTCTTNISNQNQTGTFVIGGPSATVSNATQIDITIQGQTKFDIFSIQGNAVYFGNNAGTIPDTRSTSLNMQGPLQKK